MPRRLSIKWIAWIAAVAVVGGLAATLVSMHNVSASERHFVSIYPTNAVPITKAEDDPLAVELGVRFSVSKAGSVVGLRYYKSTPNSGPHTGTLWTASGARLANASFTDESASGWQTVRFAQPIALKAGETYVASYHTSTGYYAQQQWAFSHGATLGNRTIHASGGLYAYGPGGFPNRAWHDAAYYVDVLFQPGAAGVTPSPQPPTSSQSTPTPSSSPSGRPTSGRPTISSVPTVSAPNSSSSSSTSSQPAPTGSSTPPSSGSGASPQAGVPAGTTLTPYTGPSRITKDGTVIDAKRIPSGLEIAAKNVVITRSRIEGSGDEAIHVSGSLTISDSTVTGADNGIGGDNYTATRVEITNLEDDGFKLGNNVHVDHAWCHDLSPSPQAHADCGQMQAGVVNMSVTNSWLVGGRNSALFLAPDLGPSSNGPVTISGNVLGGGNYSLYCVDGNNGQYVVKNITIANNRFMHDAQYGAATVNVPVTASNNIWYDTGKSIGGPLN